MKTSCCFWAVFHFFNDSVAFCIANSAKLMICTFEWGVVWLLYHYNEVKNFLKKNTPCG